MQLPFFGVETKKKKIDSFEKKVRRWEFINLNEP